MTEPHQPRLWVRWVAEAALIFASVFIAILLEGMADDSSRSADAHTSLVQLADELRADREDLVEVRQRQAELSVVYDDLLLWLASPEAMPGDSVQAALDRVAFLNRTMYPRRGAWSAMTSTGQLVWVGDQSLVTRLAKMYESTHDKLGYMGQDYDFNVNDFSRLSIPRAWDTQREQARVNGPADLVELRGQLRYLRLSWNTYYLDLLDEYGGEMDELLRDLEAYLGDGDI